MSYAKKAGGGGGSYQKLGGHDEENPLASDPSRQMNRKAQVIESKLTALQRSIKTLEDLCSQLGENSVDGR